MTEDTNPHDEVMTIPEVAACKEGNKRDQEKTCYTIRILHMFKGDCYEQRRNQRTPQYYDEAVCMEDS